MGCKSCKWHGRLHINQNGGPRCDEMWRQWKILKMRNQSEMPQIFEEKYRNVDRQMTAHIYSPGVWKPEWFRSIEQKEWSVTFKRLFAWNISTSVLMCTGNGTLQVSANDQNSFVEQSRSRKVWTTSTGRVIHTWWQQFQSPYQPQHDKNYGAEPSTHVLLIWIRAYLLHGCQPQKLETCSC